jgi:hypothetical protein
VEVFAQLTRQELPGQAKFAGQQSPPGNSRRDAISDLAQNRCLTKTYRCPARPLPMLTWAKRPRAELLGTQNGEKKCLLASTPMAARWSRCNI